MGCNIHKDLNWRYVIGKLESSTGLVIRSSDDYTGSSELGGNWILESDNVDLIGTYFTEDIKNYKFILNHGYGFGFIINNNDILYGFGNNTYGQLGNGNTTDIGTFVLSNTSMFDGIPVQFSTGLLHTAVLSKSGKVYVCGRNNYGQLGVSTSNLPYSSNFINITLPENKSAIQVSCGFDSTYILMSDGTAYSCGLNSSGQLGNGTTGDSYDLVQIVNNTNRRIIHICAGGEFLIVMMDNLTIYGCGSNYNAQLCNDLFNRVNASLIQLILPPGKTPKSISVGRIHTILLMTDNTVWGCGWNYSGELGTGNTSVYRNTTFVSMIIPAGKTPIQIVAGGSHSLVLMSDNTMYSCGDNQYGQLINGSYDQYSTAHPLLTLCVNNTSKTPINILNTGYYTNYIIMSDGSVYHSGMSYPLSVNSVNLKQLSYSTGGFVTNTSTKLYATVLLSNASKTYDGNTLFGINNMEKLIYTLAYGFDQSNIQITSIVGNTSSSDVATNKALNISNITLNNSNYLTCSQKIVCNILRANLTISVSSTKNYDGTNTAPLALTYTGLVSGELPNTAYTATYNSINVGTRTVTVTNFQLQNSDSCNVTNYDYNYTNTPIAPFSGTITKRILTVTPNVSDKVYDGNNNARSYTTFTFSNTIIGETPVCDFTATYNDVDIGSNKSVTITNFEFNNNFPFLSGNYTIDAIDAIPVAYGNIIAKELIVNIGSDISKIYDGDNIATNNINVTLSGSISGETPIFSYTAVYDNANVGTNKIITMSSISITDNLPFKKNNYYITNNTQILTGSITPKQLDVSISGNPTKIYDGNNTATLTFGFTGMVNQEIPNYNYVAKYNNKFAGANKPVSVTNITLQNNGSFIASNYSLGTLPNITGTINRKILTVLVDSVIDKQYDGTLDASNVLTLSLIGAISGETAAYSTYTALYDAVNCGLGIPINVINITLTSGAGGFLQGNYDIDTYPITTGNIIKRVLMASISSVTKEYDGTVSTGNITLTYTNLIPTEIPSYTYTSKYDDKNVGVNKVITISNINFSNTSTFNTANYSYNTTIQFQNCVITPKPLTATIKSVANKVYNGTTAALVVLNVTGSVTGETPLWTNTATFNTKTAGNNKLVTIRSISLRNNGAFIATNYRISVGQTKLANITKRLLGFKYLVKTRKYIKGNKKATMVFSNYNKLAADIVSISKYTATYNNDAIGNNKPVTMTGVILGGRDSANYYVLSKYTTKGNITK
jgi:alpha-tubulin suppressor-like RCC1 family protein